MQEVNASFSCFGSQCTVIVAGDGAEEAVAQARELLLEWHERFTRFDPASELSRLNRDPREAVDVTPLMARFAFAAVEAATLTGGLVDPTLVAEIEEAGYRTDHRTSVPLDEALAAAPPRHPGAPHPQRRWEQIHVDLERRTVTRPPGVQLDSGGVAKGLFADVLGEMLARHAAFAVDCAGDLRVGGAAGIARPVLVASPFEGAPILHETQLADGGVATSGIGKRSWLDEAGRPAHHLLDPSTGHPAFTGVVQATAFAPTAREAEALTKAALLSGPAQAERWLAAHGGVLVLDDGSHRVID